MVWPTLGSRTAKEQEHAKSSPLNYTNNFVLYSQNGDRIVNTDYVTSFHPMYRTPMGSHSLRVDLYNGHAVPTTGSTRNRDVVRFDFGDAAITGIRVLFIALAHSLYRDKNWALSNGPIGDG